MKNNKKVLIGIVSVVFVICVIMVIVFVTKPSKPELTTTTQKETVKISNVAPTVELENTEIDSTTSKTTVSTTQKEKATKVQKKVSKQKTTVDSEKVTSIFVNAKKDYWYYFDEKAKSCYVFNFVSDKKVRISYLSPEIIENKSNNYSREFCNYKVLENRVKFEGGLVKLPNNHFYLEIKDNELYCGKIKLEKHNRISVMDAAKHFR